MGATRSGIESRTRELVVEEPELPQVRQAADRLGNRACTSRERGTCEKSPIRFHRVAWVLRAAHTSQAVPGQIDLGHAVAELANVRRQLETGVVRQLNLAALDELPAQKLDRDGSCMHIAGTGNA